MKRRTSRKNQRNILVGGAEESSDDTDDKIPVEKLKELDKIFCLTPPPETPSNPTLLEIQAAQEYLRKEEYFKTRLDISSNNLLELESRHKIEFFNKLFGKYRRTVEFVSLDECSLSDIKIDNMGQFPKLKTLEMTDCDIETLEEGFFSEGNFPMLENLQLHRNKLTTLPKSLGKLPRLKILNLYENNFTTVPEELFENAVHLEDFNIAANPIQSLPSSIVSHAVILTRLEIDERFRNTDVINTLQMLNHRIDIEFREEL